MSTQIAGYFACKGHAHHAGRCGSPTILQAVARATPSAAKPITGWELNEEGVAKPPKGTSHVVLDTPAGLHGKRPGDLKIATHVVVPLQPSVFDIFATKPFLDELAAGSRAGKFKVGVVGMRVDERTLASDQLAALCRRLGPTEVLGLSDTQNYIQVIARGLTIFDVAPGKVERDLQQWQEPAASGWMRNCSSPVTVATRMQVPAG